MDLLVAKWRAKKSLMSVKNATLHEKRTTAQNFAEIG